MEEAERNKWETKSQELRAELKQFEGDFASEHGKKPSRNDIKKNPTIAQKYKKYQQVRDILDGKIPPRRDDTKQRKRKSPEAPAETPSKRSRLDATPSKPQQYVDIIDTFETPSIRRLFSPQIPTSIGPTPQRDGRVLGLFDLLEDENTPSRRRHGEADITIQATPSKRTYSEMEPASAIKLGRTPVSSSKRAMLNTFMTPLKKRDGNLEGAKTPTTVSKLQFSTPAFLRRAPLPPLDENGHYVSPEPIRLPRKPIVRGLSSVVASLRKMEEERLDDNLEALHEMENETASSQLAKKPVKPKEYEDVLVPDSQGQGHELLGGFDDEARLDSEPNEELGRNAQPLRVFKKKGQKRTTRRVNMRPARAKRAQKSLEEPSSDVDEDDDDEVVPETQLASNKSAEKALDPPSDSEFDGSDSDSKPEAKEKKSKATKKSKEADEKKSGEKKEGAVKKAAKKVSAMAHANFKRLKLRNHGAKGGPGFGSRFRRRK